ncbi:YdcF family protein [Aliiruegeria lutimaris]|uniref:Uncharacterized SAM-binding protein YcdF, DUF218 family n=1 Tax=Aliiruegeria lutimaris TaxID=571298 RepID=A0A1G8JN39_9RHOB|nr:YdcF family protein [Aliiruegeria lutimaris]SDI32437.1 Uncharacterized SAM-binding protein YcdF, DUF218 family [Aliiruegeria lutimaris]
MDTIFFILSKVVWTCLKPETWIVVGLVATCLLLWRRRVAGAMVSTLVTLIFVLVVGYFPIGAWLLRPIEAQYPPNPPLERVDGIIVLGGGEWAPIHGQPQVNEGAERFIEAMTLARRFPEAKVMFTGGSGALSDLGTVPGLSAGTAELFFSAMGLEQERLLLEPASRNTAENAEMGLALAQPAPDETWVLVTSAFHMPRAMRSFEAVGWTGLVAWPSDFQAVSGAAPKWSFKENTGWWLALNLESLNVAAKEYVGQIIYRLTNR